jgi:hypothetical protein
MPAGPLRCAAFQSMRPARAIRRPATPSAGGRADQQHRTAPAAAHASLVRQYAQLRALPRHGQRLSPTPPMPGPAPCGSPAGPRHVQELSQHPPIPPTYIPRRPQPRPASRERAASTTSPTRLDRFALPYAGGPIRLDFSYNLNPPIYPVNYQLLALLARDSDPHVGEAGHFNFFFSLGQTF